MSLTQHEKAIAALARALKPVTKNQNKSEVDHYQAIENALKAAQSVSFNEFLSELESELKEAKRVMDSALEQRREQLLRAAQEHGMPHKRMTDYDRVGVFKVTYKGTKSELQVGSEAMTIVTEVDGSKLFTAIREAGDKLENVPFSREAFFDVLKAAFGIAKAKSQVKDGAVAIKTLYPYVAVAWQLQREQFLKTPGSKSFQDYSSAQFVYDLARFGRDGWSIGNETLSTQTPNMATISAGKAMILPTLGSLEAQGPQLATLAIKTREG